ncbi:MAG: DNA-formamidopyrimidine glycosylase [Candidatus Promineifilaceae bacterium]|jgi:formamidopyrimidine-DNA glycosylase
MPELPEVETVVRSLRQRLIAKTIQDVENQWPRQLATHDIRALREQIAGTRIKTIHRRGKYIVFGLDSDDWLIIHLKMTGQLLIQKDQDALDNHVHTIFQLSDGEQLRFHDVRKFGRVYLTSDSSEILGALGPEPLDSSFTAPSLHKMLSGRKRIIKPLLLDQEFIAGIGNIYADEALHLAQISPRRNSAAITLAEAKRLHAGIVSTLQSAIDLGGATINDYRQPDGSEGEMQNTLRAYGREGEPCLRCSGVITRIVLGSRSTYYCPNCQV